MKKILLILALACMASAVSVANAGPRNPVINTVNVMNDSMYPVNVTFDPFGASAFTFRFPETPVAWFTLRNCNTGEYHFVSPGYALNVTVPVSDLGACASFYRWWHVQRALLCRQLSVGRRR